MAYQANQSSPSNLESGNPRTKLSGTCRRSGANMEVPSRSQSGTEVPSTVPSGPHVGAGARQDGSSKSYVRTETVQGQGGPPPGDQPSQTSGLLIGAGSVPMPTSMELKTIWLIVKALAEQQKGMQEALKQLLAAQDEESGPSGTEEPEPSPQEEGFQDLPGLQELQLQGFGAALPPRPQVSVMSPQMEAMWRAARGGSPLRRVPTSKVENIYTFPSGPFTAPGLPKALASSFVQKADAADKHQLASLGTVAAAMSKGLAALNQVVKGMRPSESQAQELIMNEVSTPFAHALRLLASRSNELAFSRKDRLVKATRDPSLASMLREAEMGAESFFVKDFSHEARQASTRAHDHLLAETLESVSAMITEPSQEGQGPVQCTSGGVPQQHSGFRSDRGTKRPFLRARLGDKDNPSQDGTPAKYTRGWGRPGTFDRRGQGWGKF